MDSNFEKYKTRFNDLKAKREVTVAEYIWIDGSGITLRSKTMCIRKKCTKLEDFPRWNYDGSTIGQSVTESSEVLLKPVFFCPDPFRPTDENSKTERSYLVLCETYNGNDETPAPANFRYYAKKMFDDAAYENPWFGFEQEYILLQHEGTSRQWPVGFPRDGYARTQGQYYCSVGPTNAIGRYVAEAHLKCCLTADLEISGINAEGFPGQWEFQIGPAGGIEVCDQLWMARYILMRVSEEFDLVPNFDPKPVKGNWNGSGCHANMSFESTRKDGGYERIMECMELLKKRHHEHVLLSGDDNEQRLTGKNESPSYDNFDWDVANRGTSVRIGNKTAKEKKGYFEDRRPSANCDPYLVGGMLVDTTILRVKYGDEMVQAFKRFKKEREEREEKQN